MYRAVHRKEKGEHLFGLLPTSELQKQQKKWTSIVFTTLNDQEYQEIVEIANYDPLGFAEIIYDIFIDSGYNIESNTSGIV